MLRNDEEPKLLGGSAYTQLLPVGPTKSREDVDGESIESQNLKNQADAHIQVAHTPGEKMLLGLSYHFERRELSTVLAFPTAEVDVHVFDSRTVDADLVVNYVASCVVRAHATLPLTAKTNFGPKVIFHDTDAFQDWLAVNLKLILQMKTLWSARPNLLAATTGVHTPDDDDDAGNRQPTALTNQWDQLTSTFF